MKRRELIKGAAMVASMPVTRLAAAEMADPPAAGGDRWRGLKAGVASYTLRKMPLEAAITAIKRVASPTSRSRTSTSRSTARPSNARRWPRSSRRRASRP